MYTNIGTITATDSGESSLMGVTLDTDFQGIKAWQDIPKDQKGYAGGGYLAGLCTFSPESLSQTLRIKLLTTSPTLCAEIPMGCPDGGSFSLTWRVYILGYSGGTWTMFIIYDLIVNGGAITNICDSFNVAEHANEGSRWLPAWDVTGQSSDDDSTIAVYGLAIT